MSEKIITRCPSCNSRGTLFVGTGGHLTCSLIDCPEPGVGKKTATLKEDLSHAIKQYEEWEAEIEKSDAVINAREEAIWELGLELNLDDPRYGFSDQTKTLVKQIIERMHKDYVMDKGKAIPLNDYPPRVAKSEAIYALWNSGEGDMGELAIGLYDLTAHYKSLWDEMGKMEQALKGASACDLCNDEEAEYRQCQKCMNDKLVGSHTDEEWAKMEQELEKHGPFCFELDTTPENWRAMEQAIIELNEVWDGYGGISDQTRKILEDLNAKTD